MYYTNNCNACLIVYIAVSKQSVKHVLCHWVPGIFESPTP